MSRFEKRGYKLVAAKMVSPGKAHLEKHYEDLKDKPFFPGLVTCESTLEGFEDNLDANKTQTCFPAQSSPWFGKVEMPARPVDPFLVLPTLSHLPQVPSEVTMPSMSAATSATALMVLRVLRRRSLCGSSQRRFSHTRALSSTGSTRSHR